jgi:hypothetical protein
MAPMSRFDRNVGDTPLREEPTRESASAQVRTMIAGIGQPRWQYRKANPSLAVANNTQIGICLVLIR